MRFSRLILTCALTAMLATPALARHGDDDDDDDRWRDSDRSYQVSRDDSERRGRSSDDDDHRRCTSAPRAAWLPLTEIESRARKMGYTVRKIETDSTCYEVYASRDGQHYELYFDPVSGVLVKLERD